jgi:hypothetical protein
MPAPYTPTLMCIDLYQTFIEDCFEKNIFAYLDCTNKFIEVLPLPRLLQ